MSVELVASTESQETQETQELMMQQAADIFQRLIYIRANLPRVLASLIDAGKEADALAAVQAWGKGTKAIDVIWQEVTVVNEPAG